MRDASFVHATGGPCPQPSQCGITVVDPQTVRTDRYEIRWERADAVRITDLTTGQYTRVWGDPHVDLSTVPGQMDGEFSDLKGSPNVTTFKLQDGTTVRFQAPDAGFIQSIDVVRGGARVHGTGAGNGKLGQFDGIGGPNYGGEGDVVYAGDDGATWYDAGGRLVWGARSLPESGRELGREAGRAAGPGVDEGDRL